MAAAFEGVQAETWVFGEDFDCLGGTAAEAVLEEYGLAGGHESDLAGGEKGTSSALRAPSPARGLEKGLHRDLSECLYVRGGLNDVPSPRPLAWRRWPKAG